MPDKEITPDKETEETITVDLEKKEVGSGEPTPTEAEITSEELRKMRNRMEYQNRQNEKLQRQLQEAVESIQSIKSGATSDKEEVATDELDEVAQKDWKKAVRILAQDEAKTLREKERVEDQKTRAGQEREMVHLQSQQRVAEKHPELTDENSDKAAVYRQIVSEDQSLWGQPYGPELAMYRMEERLRSQQSTNTERQARVGASSIPSGRGVQQGKVILTKDEKALCDENGIPYDVFARNKGKSMKDFQEGVTVDE